MRPSWDHVGTPGVVALPPLISSTTSGSADLMRSRIRPNVLPRQSPSSAILLSITADGDSFSAALTASDLRDADEVAGRVAECAVAGTPRLRGRLLQHLGAGRPDLLEGDVEVVGLEDRCLQRPLGHEREERVTLGLRPSAGRLRQDDVDVLVRGADGDPAEAMGGDVVADLEAERVAVEDE